MMKHLVIPDGKFRYPVIMTARSYDRRNRPIEYYDLREWCGPAQAVLRRLHRNKCAGNLWGVSGDSIALVAATLKAVLAIKCPASICETITGVDVGFDGTDSTKAPAVVALAQCTFATNSPGTNSTSVTPQLYGSGRPETLQLTAGKNWTAQPTVLTVFREFNIPTYMGSGLIPLQLTAAIIAGGGNGMAIEATTPTGSTPNFCGTISGNE